MTMKTLAAGGMKTWVGTVAAALLVLLGARTSLAQEPVCVPGAQLECPCPGGTNAVRACAPDGMSLLPCQCAAVPPPPAAAPPPALIPASFTVAPPAPAFGPAGSLQVSTTTPAAITVDGGEVGRAPARVGALQPGVHIVAARFDSGGESRKKVQVRTGETTVIVIDQPLSAQAAAWRQGVRVGATVGVEGFGSKSGPGMSVSPELAVNLGVSRVIDVRGAGRLTIGQAEMGQILVAGVPLSLRFNLGSTYSLGLGVLAAWYKAPVDDFPIEKKIISGLLAGGEVYPAIVRVGAKRDIELALMAAVKFSLLGGEYNVAQGGVTVTYLFL